MISILYLNAASPHVSSTITIEFAVIISVLTLFRRFDPDLCLSGCVRTSLC